MKRFCVSVVMLLCVVCGMHAKAVISGKITCSSVGLEGIMVSDGFAITYTDAKGYYSFESDKKSAYVYYTLPSGYMPYESYSYTNDQKIFPTIWQAFTYPRQPDKNETHNFKLKEKPGDNYIMMMVADIQIGNRTDNKDIVQVRNTYFTRTRQEIEDAGDTPIYSMMMGDLTFDKYWPKQQFTHKSYRALFAEYYNSHKMYQFPVMGNHDNDATTLCTDSTDYEATKEWRENMGPAYYSFNIGKIHYIVLDNIMYINSGSPIESGCAGSTNYHTGISDQQFEWIKKDLETVPKDKTIFLCAHCPLWTVYFDGSTSPFMNYPQHTIDISNMLKDYKQVHIFSGHRHNLYNIEPANYGYPNFYEHTLSCVGGNLWWTEFYSPGHCNGSDGVPAGYQMVYVNGDSITWRFHTLRENDNAQFRIIDGNTVREFYKTDSVIPKMLVKYADRQDYSTIADNAVLVNVFNYDSKWKIEVTEEGEPLQMVRTPMEDPYHTLTYDIPRWQYWVGKDGNGRYTTSMATGHNPHTFVGYAKSPTSSVTVKVTDRFGTIYKKTMKRPIPCTIDALTEGGEEMILTDVQQAIIEANTTYVYVTAAGINIDAKEKGVARITSMNGATKVVVVNEGHNEYELQQGGIYIVTYNGKSKKVFVR